MQLSSLSFDSVMHAAVSLNKLTFARQRYREMQNKMWRRSPVHLEKSSSCVSRKDETSRTEKNLLKLWVEKGRRRSWLLFSLPFLFCSLRFFVFEKERHQTSASVVKRNQRFKTKEEVSSKSLLPLVSSFTTESLHTFILETITRGFF
jgi:hypothetical protein